MSTTFTPSLTAGHETPDARDGGRGWALAGAAAAVAGIVSVFGSSRADAVYEDALAGDATGIAARLAEQTTPILVFHTAAMVCALLLVVFATGLRRELARRLGADSLLPGIAAAGLLLVVVAQLMGSALTTEFVFGLQDPDLVVPETAVLFGHWIGTVPWLWGTAGLSALAVAVAALRFRAFARWVGWTSAVLGGLCTLFAISPLQYMAGMVGPIWLLVVSVGLVATRQRER